MITYLHIIDGVLVRLSVSSVPELPSECCQLSICQPFVGLLLLLFFLQKPNMFGKLDKETITADISEN